MADAAPASSAPADPAPAPAPEPAPAAEPAPAQEPPSPVIDDQAPAAPATVQDAPNPSEEAPATVATESGPPVPEQPPAVVEPIEQPAPAAPAPEAAPAPVDSSPKVTFQEPASQQTFPSEVDVDALRQARNAYVLPKLVVTPVDLVASSEQADVPARTGFAHVACQTIISSAPVLKVDAVSNVVIDDPVVSEVVLVMKRYQRILRRVFDHYASIEHAGGRRAMDLPLFLSFAKEFSILPTLIEQDEIGDVFAASCRDGGGHLGFRDLIECLTRLALTIYRDNRRVQTAEQKLTYLLRAMQLDQKDIVMHRLRKAVVQTNTTRPPTNDAVSFDFEQKDLDDEIKKIMETFPTEGDLATPATERPGPEPMQASPLSAQIKSTIDAVRVHTDEIARGGSVPTRPRPAGALPPPVTMAPVKPTVEESLVRPAGPLPSLAPLYYPGAMPQMLSYSRIYERKRSVGDDSTGYLAPEPVALTATASPSSSGRSTTKLSPVRGKNANEKQAATKKIAETKNGPVNQAAQRSENAANSNKATATKKKQQQLVQEAGKEKIGAGPAKAKGKATAAAEKQVRRKNGNTITVG
ncbi:EF-hand domain-containing protein [Plasmodiophora brassicae]